MTKRRWTDEERTHALNVYQLEGPHEAARQTGIPVGTIASWAHRNGLQTDCHSKTADATEAARLKWEERRATMVTRMGEIAAKALERVDHAIEGEGPEGGPLLVPGAFGLPTLIHPSDAKALATTMAILIDKAQLLSGEASVRVEHRHVDKVDAELEDMAARFEPST